MAISIAIDYNRGKSERAPYTHEFCLSVYLSVCLSICLSVGLYVHNTVIYKCSANIQIIPPVVDCSFEDLFSALFLYHSHM